MCCQILADLSYLLGRVSKVSCFTVVARGVSQANGVCESSWMDLFCEFPDVFNAIRVIVVPEAMPNNER